VRKRRKGRRGKKVATALLPRARGEREKEGGREGGREGGTPSTSVGLG